MTSLDAPLVRPPRLAARLVRLMVSRSPYADSLLGDLDEGFAREARSSPATAAWWYRRRALSIACRYLPHRLAPEAPAYAVTEPNGDSAMMTFLADLRFAARTLTRAPGFAVAALVALGLGIGSAAAVFSLLRGVVLRPLPYASPERLVMLWEVNHAKGLEHEQISPVNFGDYRALGGVFEDAAAWWRPQINLADDAGEPVRVSAIETTENLFAVLGVGPMLGRGFTIHPQLFGNEHEAIISHRLWQSRFGGTDAVIGKPVKLNGFDFTVVGVMPPGFAFPGETDLWQQLDWDLAGHSRAAHFMEAVARVRPGVTPEHASRELAALGARLAVEHAATNGDWRARVVPLDREITGPFRPALFALFGASALLLLIACINVANLLLARAAARRREVAVRAAIGASRSRLVRLFLTESLVLAAAGAALGFVVAVAAVKGLLAWSPVHIPRGDEVGIDGAVLAFAVGLTALTAVVFGLGPALLMSRAELQETMKEGARGSETRGRALRGGLVVAEVALAVVLLSGAGLLIRSVAGLLRVDAGLDPASSITVDVQLPDAAYDEWERVERFYSSLGEALRASPAVVSAGAANFLPLEAAWRTPYAVAGIATTPESAPTAQWNIADEGWFAALRVPLLAGRTFEARDDARAAPVVVVNEALARLAWPGERAVGKRLTTRIRGAGPLSRRLVSSGDYEVIGVVGDVKNSSLRTAAEPAMWYSVRQFPSRKMHLVLRGSATTATLAAIVKEEVRKLDPALPLGEVRPMTRVLAESVDPPRFVMLLMSVFAALALTLAAVGIYGILSYVVSHRRREIGIRLALGAQPAEMLRMIVREGVGLAVVGCALGAAGTIAAGASLSGFLYGVPPWDPMTLAGVVLLVIAVAAAACVVPGRRAAAEDPASALRGA